MSTTFGRGGAGGAAGAAMIRPATMARQTSRSRNHVEERGGLIGYSLVDPVIDRLPLLAEDRHDNGVPVATLEEGVLAEAALDAEADLLIHLQGAIVVFVDTQ